MEANEQRPKVERIQSTIGFPYSDIGDAIEVAEGLLKGGGMALSRDQLAAAMGQTPTSGSFNTKLGTARSFGVMETVQGKYQLTPLGHEIVDPTRQRAAMARAFLSVELYKRTFDEFKGKLLPPRPTGLEAAFVNFGVSPKQKERARQAFDKSARLAGFFPNGSDDRLVEPFGHVTHLQPLVTTSADSANNLAVLSAEQNQSVAGTRSLKTLHYELVDLLSEDGIGDEESEAIWTLVRFLKNKGRNRPQSPA